MPKNLSAKNIEQEIGAAQDTPDDVIFEHLSELCYPEQPVSRSLLGTPQTLAGFNRDNLQGYLSTHYRGPRNGGGCCWRCGSQARGRGSRGAFREFRRYAISKPSPAMFGKGGLRG